MFLLFLLFVASYASEQPCLDYESVDISDVKSSEDGSIVKDGVVFPPKYVYTKNVDGEIRTFGCLCQSKNCFRKCCPMGSVFYQRNCTEMPHLDVLLNDGFASFYAKKFQKRVDLTKKTFDLIYGKPCDAVYLEDNPWYVQEMEFRLRANPEQFSIMLDFMERNGDLSRPQPGAQGRLRAEHQWNELTELLNSVGGSGVQKQADKWKRVWSDWKTKTKKKASLITRETQGTGGGPSRARPLNPLEERLLRIIGLRSIMGHQEVQEAGFAVQPSSEPIVRTPSPQPTQMSSPPPVPEASTSQQLELPHTPEPQPLINMETLNVACNSRRHEEVIRSPSAGPSTPRRRRVTGQRRRRYQTPFEQATSEFVRVENERLRLEELRIIKQHEKEMEQLRVESVRIAMEERRNNILQSIADTASNVMELLSRSRLLRD